MKSNNKQFEEWALKTLEHFQVVLHLTQYTPLQLEYVKEHKGAECQFYYPYSTLTIRYGDVLKDYFESKNIEMARKILVHELCHAITDPFYAKATTLFASKTEIEDERERLTDHIANIVLTNKL